MLERATRTFDDFLEEHNLVSLENKRNLRRKLTKQPLSKPDELPDAHNMTRKTRTRKLRIAVIQSGYCAVCNIPYNSVEDHIQSKKHQKLIGEDANYIALNGSLNGYLHTNSIPFLNLNGIDGIGVHETSLDDYSPMFKRRNMSKIRSVRATSVMCDRIKPSPLSPTESDITGHHLRSRRNINYMTPPLDDDSLQETPDLNLLEEPVRKEFKEYRELRSSTRALAKLTEQLHDTHEEVWNSGRPKRACINKRRLSLDERSAANCKTYYKVEVMTSKSKSSQKDQESRHQNFSPKREDEKDKGLIVKFKKLRNSELIQLNNEATNFLFPKKDDSSEEDEDTEQYKVKHIKSTKDKNSESVNVTSEESEDCNTNFYKVKAEDEGSSDSNFSINRSKKKRRTHAEAFIMDNQKYYKFETPGSRLRYHGSYLQPIVKSPKHNGECSLKTDSIKLEEPEEKKPKVKSSKMNLDNYNFSFEKVPEHAPWYEVYQRLDNGKQRYTIFSDYFWDPMILPYQMPYLSPLDPKECIHHYNTLMKELKELKEPISETESTCTSPEPSISASTPSLYDPEQDEDSKMSATTLSSTCSVEESNSNEKRRVRRTKAAMLQQMCTVKNPRKSPRQHASTLAILSSLIQQRKRRLRTKGLDEPSSSLPSIPEETSQMISSSATEKNEERLLKKGKTIVKRKGFFRRFKPKIDYISIAQKIEDELDTALEGNLEDYDLDLVEENPVDFHNSKTNTSEILRLFEESKAKETEKSCRRFFNGTPGRKPGRKKKKNLTGWPKQKRVGPKRGQSKEKEKEEDNSTSDSVSVNNESSDVEERNVNSTVVKQKSECINKKINRVYKNRLLINTVTKDVLQPYVCVQKLDNAIISKRVCTPKRTVKRQRRTLTSPRSPRNLRKPRGRWYKER